LHFVAVRILAYRVDRNTQQIVRHRQKNGLYCLSLKGSERQPVSKRRCVAFISKNVVVPLAAGQSKGFVSAWQLAPEEPKADATQEEK
jgi:hypothetical protein